ncbi:MAG: transketolase family protein, partial [Firmicutes bacterium]|nr:transketolase family protein [Bacillota bacterium]
MKMNLKDLIMQRLVFGKTLVELGAEYENLVVMDADVAQSTQTHFFRDAYPDRFYQIGIAEQNMAGIAAGMSTLGYIPFISAFAVFMTQRAGDQIRNSIAHPRANVKINGGYGGLPTGRGGATHSAVEDIAVMRCLPNMTILEPADPRETELCTRLAMEIEGPVYLRTVRCEVPVVFPEDHKVLLGKAFKVRDGKDVTIISSGMMTPKAIDAADGLAAQGVSVNMIHMPSIKPIDKEAILEAAETTKAIITVENHSVIGGLGSAVCETVAEGYPCKVFRFGFKDVF